jgi:macrodomain Ter protein organizer (MatP/YcbG family)
MKKVTKPVFIRLEVTVKERISKMAEYKGMTVSSLIRNYLIEKLREDERRRSKENVA